MTLVKIAAIGFRANADFKVAYPCLFGKPKIVDMQDRNNERLDILLHLG
jgi:hypothetical protein